MKPVRKSAFFTTSNRSRTGHETGLRQPRPGPRLSANGCSVDPRGRVPRGGGELAAGRQLAAPASEQCLDLRPGRRDPQGGVLGSPRAVHLVDRALDDPPGHPMDLDLVPQFQEQEVRGQRLRAGQAGTTRRTPQHLPECTRRRRSAPYPTAAGRTMPASGPGARRPRGWCRPPALPKPARGRTRRARRSRTAPVPPPRPDRGTRAGRVRLPASTRASSPSSQSQIGRTK